MQHQFKAKKILFQPARLPNKVLRRERKCSGKTMTRLLEEALVKTYGGAKERAGFFGLAAAE